LKHDRLIVKALLFAICAVAVGASGTQAADGVSVFAAGLNQPRGVKFGPDGYLYVAEAGLGGTNSTIGLCPQVPTPPGPYTGGGTARISKVAPNGTRITVADRLPSATASNGGGGNEGVADVVFIGDELYALSRPSRNQTG
jgi:hypothetical protein